MEVIVIPSAPPPAPNKAYCPMVCNLLLPSLLPKVVILTLGQNTKQKSLNSYNFDGIFETLILEQDLKHPEPIVSKLLGNSFISNFPQ